MRKIKFKAKFKRLNDDYERWQYVVLEKNFKNLNLDAINLVERDYLQVSDWFQYTGLKNKNGKEIYDGDIVKLNTSIFYVEFYCASFWLKDRNNDRTGLSSEVEIIGNIYENPELLDK